MNELYIVATLPKQGNWQVSEMVPKERALTIKTHMEKLNYFTQIKLFKLTLKQTQC